MTRPYTAILVNWQGHNTQVITVEGSTESGQAAQQVAADYPGCCLVALVPGDHSGHSHAYPLRYNGTPVTGSGPLSEAQQLDLFDIDVNAFED